jgi:hypothetical protein
MRSDLGKRRRRTHALQRKTSKPLLPNSSVRRRTTMTPGICFSAGRSTTRTSNPFALSASGFARSVRQLLAGTSSHPRPTKRFRSSEARASACSTLGHSSARINSSPMRNPSVKPAGLSVSSQRIMSTKPVNVHTAYGSSGSSFEATPSPARATGIVSGRWGSTRPATGSRVGATGCTICWIAERRGTRPSPHVLLPSGDAWRDAGGHTKTRRDTATSSRLNGICTQAQPP